MFKTLKIATLAIALTAAPAMARDVTRLAAVVTDANPQTQLMSMVLTNQALDRGVKTKILLCGPAADIALKDAPESATAGQPPQGASPQGLLQAAIKKGAKAEVCALYLPGKGLEADALIDGVTVAQPPAMARDLVESGTRVWSF
ncbi:putative peroxiredoxin [Rhodovulum bhavnagarense]|uniref:Putative peroxiredoxin n=1 Tax=Rhodovulum bhavnagarense TaxID=992286 RepID=A0A4R2RE39_9RHOB|nr:DsrE family protein [Rhodovulum bhavnagarense]TCP60267.1 putative peroxiredoxin [Rhodovulum bhavnagarense]